MFCDQCGMSVREGVKFCPGCGAKMKQAQQTVYQEAQPPVQPAAQQWQQQQPQAPLQSPAPPQPPQYTPPQPPSPLQPSAPAQQPQYTPATGQQPAPAGKKLSKGLLAVIIAVPLVIIAGVVIFLFTRNNNDEDILTPSVISDKTPETPQESPPESPPAIKVLPEVNYTYLSKQPEAYVELTTIDSLFPSNYRTLESLVTFTGYCEYGEMDVMVEVEVPGFTQPYKQKVHLGRQVTKLRIVPPLVTGDLDLSSEKMAQIVYSVTEIDTGKILEYESRSLKLFSKFDIVWGDEENWDAYTDDILAWMTPDAPEILTLQRDAIDYLSYISDGQLDALIGYQDYNFFDYYYDNTWVQAVAIQGAMSDITQVRYNMAPFSMDAQQRVKMPADTLKSKSGLCVETSLVMASALQSAGMHVMLLFPPGHCQVAVEAWPGTGDYYLIETTILPMPQDMDSWTNTVRFMTKDEWYEYIDGAPCYVVDCDLGAKLGIRVISN